jgi:uncharacterized membrane protein YfcA
MSLLLSVLSGLAAGTISGTFGIGGGAVLVPLLALMLGLDQHRSQGVTLAILLLPVALAAVLEYHRLGAVRWRLVAPLVGGFLLGVGAGSLAANAIPERPLQLFFVGFLFISAARTWWWAGRDPGASAQARPPPRQAALHAIWIGAAGGAASGLLGIGGAVVMIPLTVLVLGLTHFQAQGTSLATMLPPIGLPGVLVYARAQGGLPWAVMAAVAVGFLAGGAAGARLAHRIRGPRLEWAFAAFQVAVALSLLWRALRA